MLRAGVPLDIVSILITTGIASVLLLTGWQVLLEQRRVTALAARRFGGAG
jgi:hypothetical protein